MADKKKKPESEVLDLDAVKDPNEVLDMDAVDQTVAEANKPYPGMNTYPGPEPKFETNFFENVENKLNDQQVQSHGVPFVENLSRNLSDKVDKVRSKLNTAPLESKYAKLKELRDKKIISEEVFNQQSSKLSSEMSDELNADAQRTLAKADRDVKLRLEELNKELALVELPPLTELPQSEKDKIYNKYKVVDGPIGDEEESQPENTDNKPLGGLNSTTEQTDSGDNTNRSGGGVSSGSGTGFGGVRSKLKSLDDELSVRLFGKESDVNFRNPTQTELVQRKTIQDSFDKGFINQDQYKNLMSQWEGNLRVQGTSGYFEQQKKLLQEQGKIETTAAAKIAEQTGHSVAEVEKAYELLKKQNAARIEKQEAIFKQLENFKLDPNRFYKNTNTGSMMKAAFFRSALGIMSGKSGAGQDYINEMVAKDIAEQTSEYNRNVSLYSMFRELGKDQQQAFEDTVRYSDVLMKKQIEKIGAEMNVPVAALNNLKQQVELAHAEVMQKYQMDVNHALGIYGGVNLNQGGKKKPEFKQEDLTKFNKDLEKDYYPNMKTAKDLYQIADALESAGGKLPRIFTDPTTLTAAIMNNKELREVQQKLQIIINKELKRDAGSAVSANEMERTLVTYGHTPDALRNRANYSLQTAQEALKDTATGYAPEVVYEWENRNSSRLQSEQRQRKTTADKKAPGQ